MIICLETFTNLLKYKDFLKQQSLYLDPIQYEALHLYISGGIDNRQITGVGNNEIIYFRILINTNKK